MISRHDANTRWWNADVGLVSERAFFDLPATEQAKLLAPYAWVEWKAPLSAAESRLYQSCRFMFVDCQLGFSLDLSALKEFALPAGATLCSAAQRPFTIQQDEIRSFTNERFAALPGITQERLDCRYVSWANQLTAECPEYALELRKDTIVQGWYFGRPTPAGFDLVLAMLHREATISGRMLYGSAYRYYWEHGITVGHASFSTTNLAVMNILSRFGARFQSALGCWLWLPAESRLSADSSQKL